MPHQYGFPRLSSVVFLPVAYSKKSIDVLFGASPTAKKYRPRSAITKFNGADYDGRKLTVNEARPMAPRTGGGRF